MRPPLPRHPARPALVAVLALARAGVAWPTAVAVSGALVTGVAIAAPRLSPDAFRVLADAALLAPLFL